MKDIERFITGFRRFREDYFGSEYSPFEHLKQGQTPKTMIIACSDSRVDRPSSPTARRAISSASATWQTWSLRSRKTAGITG
ncbi:hypothetical protein [Geobacter anodireducens]